MGQRKPRIAGNPRSYKKGMGQVLPQCLQGEHGQQLNFRLPSSRAMRIHFRGFKPPSLWNFVMGALAMNVGGRLVQLSVLMWRCQVGRGYTSLEFRREAQAADRNVEDVSKQNAFKAMRLDEIRAAREKTEPGVIQS